MTWASGEAVGVLAFLLPGFVAAAVFYSLTSYPKPGALDRVAQALIFTVVAQAITAAIPTNDGGAASTASWNHHIEPMLPIAVSILLAIAVAYAVNKDIVHDTFRRLGVTKETSYPSEWYSAFSRHHGCYVVLHLEGERRLYGWPEEWPGRPDEGHFRIADAEWLVEDERHPAEGVSAVLIPASAVEMVEFLQASEETEHG